MLPGRFVALVERALTDLIDWSIDSLIAWRFKTLLNAAKSRVKPPHIRRNLQQTSSALSAQSVCIIAEGEAICNIIKEHYPSVILPRPRLY